MTQAAHLTTQQLLAGLTAIGHSPQTEGVLEMIVRRPASGEREVVDAGELDPAVGLVGDSWRARLEPDDISDPTVADSQLTLMNARVAALVAGDRSRWPLAGDQLFVDFDLSRTNVPPGTRLQVGTSVVEVSAEPHTGCGRFVARFGVDAMKFVNSPLGRDLQLRGVNARVIAAGVIRKGDAVVKLVP
jgi:hypothetical protein